MDFRAREDAGYLFHNEGAGDWLTIFIPEKGAVTATCNNGGGEFSVTVKTGKVFCDGELHSLLLEKKGKTLTLTVDGVTETVTTEKSSSAANTNSPIFMGGIPGKFMKREYSSRALLPSLKIL